MSSAAMSGKAEKHDFSITCTLDDNWYDWAAHLATACGLVSSYSVAKMFIAVVAVSKLLRPAWRPVVLNDLWQLNLPFKLTHCSTSKACFSHWVPFSRTPYFHLCICWFVCNKILQKLQSSIYAKQTRCIFNKKKVTDSTGGLQLKLVWCLLCMDYEQYCNVR